MDKFEFSDLYKFLVSAGIILMGLAFILPWFYLKEPFDLLIEKNKILLLTNEAQNIIKGRQSLIGNLYFTLPYASGFLFICGITSIFLGLRNWFRKQADIDKRDFLTTEKLEKEVKDMTSTDIEKKNEKEFKEAAKVNSDTEEPGFTTTTTIAPTKETFLLSYVQIEQFLSNKLTSIFQSRYKILPNIRIREDSVNAEYDLVLSSEVSIVTDLIFEFKYYPNGVTKATVQENIQKLDWKSNLYSNKVKSNIMPILLIVLPVERFNEERFAVLRMLPKKLDLVNENLKVDFVKIQDLDSLDGNYFFKLMSS